MSKIEVSLVKQLCRFAAALVNGNEDIITDAINRAVESGLSTLQLREVILTSYLFDGYPTALEGFRILTDITGSVPENTPELIYTPDNIATWRRRGEPLCREIYGPQYEPLMKRVAQIAPELSDAMIVEGYGKVLAREGLEPRIRELCVVTILTSKYKPRQLLSHAIGALRLGATPGSLYDALNAAVEIVPQENIERSKKVIENAIHQTGLP